MSGALDFAVGFATGAALAVLIGAPMVRQLVTNAVATERRRHVVMMPRRLRRL